MIVRRVNMSLFYKIVFVAKLMNMFLVLMNVLTVRIAVPNSNGVAFEAVRCHV